MLSIYTDGSCINNPGKGGFAIIVVKNDETIYQFSQNDNFTTNNIMEMKAFEKALDFIITYQEDHSFNIYTDSVYVKNGITNWINNWKINGFKTSKNKEIKNKQLWIDIDKKYSSIKHGKLHNIIWVKAHNGDKWNEAVDKLAFQSAQNN